MVGDRLDTDIMFGKNGGIATMLVMTGMCLPKPSQYPLSTLVFTFLTVSHDSSSHFPLSQRNLYDSLYVTTVGRNRHSLALPLDLTSPLTMSFSDLYTTATPVHRTFSGVTTEKGLSSAPAESIPDYVVSSLGDLRVLA